MSVSVASVGLACHGLGRDRGDERDPHVARVVIIAAVVSSRSRSAASTYFFAQMRMRLNG